MRAEPPTKALVAHVEHVFSGTTGYSGDKPDFAITGSTEDASPRSFSDATGSLPDSVAAKHELVAFAKDGSAAWLTADLAETTVCGEGDCDHQKPLAWWHALVVFDRTQPDPHAIAWHVATVVSAKATAAAIKKGAKLDGLDRRIAKGAEAAAKVFESSLGDPAAFAASVSDRKDVVLFGSEAGERYVGTAAVTKQLKAWKLAMTLVGNGVVAGLASKSVAWVAANVEAKPTSKPAAKPIPFRVLAVYERAGTDWKLVAAEFSFDG